MPNSNGHGDWYRRTVLGIISSAAVPAVFSGIGGADAPQNQLDRAPRKPMKGGSNALDSINFGNPGSESRHDLRVGTSETVRGKEGRSARRLLPLNAPEHQLGSMSFTLRCDSEYRTYLTLKFKSNPDNFKRLFLFDGTEMIGYMEPGVGWPSLDMGSQPGSFGAISTHGEFWYATHRLPGYLTEDSDEVELRIVSWDGEQPSQNIYRAYTHTDPYLQPPANDKRGGQFELGPIRDVSAESQIEPVVEQIDELVREGQQKSTISPRGALGLAMAAQRDWIDAVDTDAVFETVRKTVDDWAIRQAKSAPHEVVHRGWEEHGRFARSITLLWEDFEEHDAFRQKLEGHPAGEITRRDAYVQFFGEGLDWRSKSRREVTNQIMFVTIALVRMNSVLKKLDSDRTRSQETVDRWIDEAIGLTSLTVTDDETLPVSQFYESFASWSDYDPEADGEVKYMPWFESGSYHTVSEKGLAKEPDHVAHYGELALSLIVKLYHETGLERVHERAIEASQARAPFRLLVNDAETGNRWAAAEGTVGVRNVEHPGMAGHLRGYGFKPLFHALKLGDPVSVRFGKLAIDHNVAGSMNQWWFDVWGVGSQSGGFIGSKDTGQCRRWMTRRTAHRCTAIDSRGLMRTWARSASLMARIGCLRISGTGALLTSTIGE
ncbi:hypothetical protein ACFQJ8_21715 [Halocatena marina]|uniref:hypothetical protein n=1 Tax=Halocatena marina TaxID=2934937 RepID=UPI00360F3801